MPLALVCLWFSLYYIKLLPFLSIRFFSGLTYNSDKYKRFITHEMGHAFENALQETLGAKLGRNILSGSKYADLITPKVNINPGDENGVYNGFEGGSLDWQWRLTKHELYPYEVFADMFVG